MAKSAVNEPEVYEVWYTLDGDRRHVKRDNKAEAKAEIDALAELGAEDFETRQIISKVVAL